MTEFFAAEPVGERIGNYRILKKIASGGMARLYLCCGVEDVALRAVVKVLRPEGFRDETVRSRFLREGELCTGMEHPGIVRIFETGAWRESCYIVMEWIDGRNLEELKNAGVDFSVENALEIAWRIGDALRWAWNACRLLHRDVKPANIMIDVAGNVKLLDFGIAKRLDENSAALTMTGRSLGTPRFMSPEQFLGRRDIDCRSDIYSLGATLYYMLSGKYPFDTEDPGGIYRAVVEKEPRPLDRLVPGIAPETVLLVRRMMAKKPEKRFQNWDETLDAIDRMIVGAEH